MTIGNGSVAQGQASKLRPVLVDNEYVSKEPAIGIEAQPRDCFLNMLINDRAPKSCNNGRLERRVLKYLRVRVPRNFGKGQIFRWKVR